MPNMDEHGNKIADKKIKKSIVSRAVRAFRKQNKIGKYCNECGFKVRGSNHESGRHHNEVS